MKKNLLIIILLFLFSCKPTLQQDVVGKFYKNGKWYKYTLKLNPDSTFFLKQDYGHGKPQCYGCWYFLSKDTLLLKCNQADFSEALSNGYMWPREKKVKVLSRNKLKLDGKILKMIEKPENVHR